MGEQGDLMERAMEALQESTTILQVAGKLLDQGNVKEAKRLRDQARARRNISVWLMAKANALEQGFRGIPKASYHESQRSTAH